MNILVTGANGQLGRSIRCVAAESCNRYFYTDIQELDITCRVAVAEFVSANSIDVIVNCAAYTNVDAAEDDLHAAELLNSTAVDNLAMAMKSRGGFLLHISTDYVFGGEVYNRPCREEQQGTPTGVYGLTKLQGEQAVIASGCDHIIIRTSWLYSEYGRNFVKTMLDLTATRPELKVVFDQVGTPTYAADLAKVIYDILENGKYVGKEGIYHFSNEGVCSWYDFAKAIAEIAGHKGRNILPCHSNEFPSKVVRPSYSVLDKTKIKETFGVQVPYWRDSLLKCIENLKSDGKK